VDASQRLRKWYDGLPAMPSVIERQDPNTNPLAGDEALKLAKEVDRLKNELKLAKQDIETRKKIHEMYKLTRMDDLVAVTQVVTQWNAKAKGKTSKRDRTWQMALHLLRELNEALKIDSPGSAEEQPAEGGK